MTEARGVVYFAVDAGGTHTRLHAWSDGRAWSVAAAPVNPASVGPETATAALTAALRQFRSEFGGRRRWHGWIASAAVSERSIADECRRTRECCRVLDGRGTVILTNDVTPLLVSSPLSGNGIVIVAGTGSCVLGRGPKGVASTGGCEYLASDEGGGFDIGLHGLRAAARAVDGRGPATALVQACIDDLGGPVREVGRRLAAEPFPKRPVAAFAAAVVRAADAGDAVARDIVLQAVEELAVGVPAVFDRTGLRRGAHVLLAGGLFSASRLLRESLSAEVTALVLDAVIHVGANTAERAVGHLRSGPREAELAGFCAEEISL